ncbi:MAG: DUF5683 domain-containing protein [Paludibacteraceae bacterium]|nr:DUF5683 domain-containing protein [Paludibacteraceae bacterium]
MKRRLTVILLCLPLCLFAQKKVIANGDSVRMTIVSAVDSASAPQADTLVVLDNQDEIIIGESMSPNPQGTWDDGWRPQPLRAVWMGALFPGLGQIYNRSYWKLPIVYGAFMGSAYAIIWNGTMYKDYKQAYWDILTDKELSTDPKRSYNAILPKGYTIEQMGGRSTYTKTLNNKQNLYRRYRDFGIVAVVAVYALSLIDAFVDAQLFDFDISPDLSMNVSPQIYNDFMNHQHAAEVHLAITIK